MNRNPVKTCTQAWTTFKAPKPHPLTGDMLAPGERITWHVMGIYRRWSVFIGLQILTLFWWTHPGTFPGGLIGWNLLWSDLAVAVEMLVGIAFLNQSMRDAKIIRNSLKDQEALLRGQGADGQLLRSIYAALHPDGEGALVVKIDGVAHTLELTQDSAEDIDNGPDPHQASEDPS